jgi:hypothetical protein
MRMVALAVFTSEARWRVRRWRGGVLEVGEEDLGEVEGVEDS